MVEKIGLSRENAEQIAQKLRTLLVGKNLLIPASFGRTEEGRLKTDYHYEEVSIYYGDYQDVTIWLYLPNEHQAFSSPSHESTTFTFYEDRVTVEFVTPGGNELSQTYRLAEEL